MCFKSWLYNSSMLQDEFDEEDEREEDCEVSEAWSDNHEDNIQYYINSL